MMRSSASEAVFAVNEFTDVGFMEDTVQQQSSPHATLRAALMLCLLFCIPTIAIFDRPLREFVREVLHRDSKSHRAVATHEAAEDETDESWPGSTQGSAAAGAANLQAPVVGTDATGSASATSQVPPGEAGLLPGPHGSTPAWSETPPPVAPASEPPRREPWQNAPPVSDAAEEDTFDSMHRRLEQLGATYYLLETWGRGGALYRFHCKMAIGENPNFTRQFEATDSNPMVAMKRVLGEVETWHAKRQY